MSENSNVTVPEGNPAIPASVPPTTVGVNGRHPLPPGEDDADEEAFEAADRLSPALAFGSFAFEVGAGGGVIAGLRDRDPVERGVELAVAAPVEPVPLDAA